MNQYPTVTPAGGSAETQNYDNNGNLTGDGTSTYSYDPENHLMTASNTGMSATYAYDPLGRRETKTVGSTVTEFLNDGQDEIAEYDASGDVLRRFVPGPAINEPIVYENCLGATNPNCTGTGPSIEYYHTDHHGSVIATSGASQAIQEGPYIYDPTGIGGLTSGQPFQYVGMYYDFETGLYYDRARYYSPWLGRFLQTDPVGYKDDIDWYTYVGNDPVNKTDPTGKATTCNGTGQNAQCTMTADTFDPARSDHRTAIPSPSVKAAVAQGMDKVATFSGKEKMGYVMPGPDGTPTLQPDSNATTSSSLTANIARSTVPQGALAVAHGHDEIGPTALKGMVDSTRDAGGLGDAQSLSLSTPIPTATVFRGDVGWHQIQDGQLQFTFRAGALTGPQASAMQGNLNNEQQFFQLALGGGR